MRPFGSAVILSADNGIQMTHIYLDYAATTPLHPQVFHAMTDVMENLSGNPSSIHQVGRQVKYRLTQARDSIAAGIGARGDEIIFNSGGTEADNLAIKGLALAHQHKGRHIITSRVEHKAVAASCEWLKQMGFEVTYLETDQYGIVDPATLKNALRPDTILVSLIWVNNELGSVNPILELGKMVHQQKAVFHSDAVQALGKIPIQVADLPVDALSISAHKIYGPKGVGALWLRKGVGITSLISGGAQESNLRGGTENLSGIVGFAAAVEMMQQDFEKHASEMSALITKLASHLSPLPGIQINTHPELRAPGILNFSVANIDGESLFINLDRAGVAISNGSACTSGAQQPSEILTAIGLSKELARATVRVSIGRETTGEEIESFVGILKREIDKLQKINRNRNRQR